MRMGKPMMKSPSYLLTWTVNFTRSSSLRRFAVWQAKAGTLTSHSSASHPTTPFSKSLRRRRMLVVILYGPVAMRRTIDCRQLSRSWQRGWRLHIISRVSIRWRTRLVKSWSRTTEAPPRILDWISRRYIRLWERIQWLVGRVCSRLEVRWGLDGSTMLRNGRAKSWKTTVGILWNSGSDFTRIDDGI